MDAGEEVAGKTRPAQALQGIVNPRKHHVAHKGKNSGVGVQGPQAPECQELDPLAFKRSKADPFQELPVHLPEVQLGGDHNPHQ